MKYTKKESVVMYCKKCNCDTEHFIYTRENKQTVCIPCRNLYNKQYIAKKLLENPGYSKLVYDKYTKEPTVEKNKQEFNRISDILVQYSNINPLNLDIKHIRNSIRRTGIKDIISISELQLVDAIKAVQVRAYKRIATRKFGSKYFYNLTHGKLTKDEYTKIVKSYVEKDLKYFKNILYIQNN